jgi:hypothetical protein
MVLFPVAAQTENRVALVIGIDKYDNLGPQAQLRKAKGDSAAIAKALKDLGFDVIAKDDVTRSAFNSHWQDFLNKLSPGDTAAFYFAGHGIELGGRNYLIPRDVPNLRPGREELLKRESLSLQEFLTDLRERGTRLNIVILDACRDNPFDQLTGRTLGGARGLAVTEPPEGTFIMYSAGAGETALDRLNDSDNNPNSVYTRQLLPLLKSPGLTLTDVAEQVRVAVRQTASGVQHRQTPAYYNQVLGRVCIAGCTPPITVPPPTAPPVMLQSEAAEAWDRTKDTTNIALLQAFLARYKNTFYAEHAQARLDELKKHQVAAAIPPPAAKPALVEATKEDGSKLAEALQRELKRVGCDPGAVDGAWGTKARQALGEFSRLTKISLPADEPSDAALKAVTGQKGRICPLRCGSGETAVSGKCVAKAQPVDTRKAPQPRKADDTAKGGAKGPGMCWGSGISGQWNFVPCDTPGARGKAF